MVHLNRPRSLDSIDWNSVWQSKLFCVPSPPVEEKFKSNRHATSQKTK
jgi:hypothetical protein